jgi:anti-anti-sigma factor
MEENIQRKGEVIIIGMPDRLEVNNSVKMENLINSIIDEGNKFLIFDMSNVSYISSSGLRIFISTIRKIRDMDGQLKISGMNDKVKKVFIMVELYDLLEDYPTLEDAIESYGNLAQ